MDPKLLELLRGAGLADIVIPRKDFVKEHQHLIQLLRKSNDPALRKEASSQEKELKKEVKGGKKMSAQSGFIRRLMAENTVKHQGQYRNPTWRLHPDSQMKAPWKFEYHKLANQEQSDQGENEEAYGASPFIQKHFGHAQAVPFVRKRGQPYPTEPFKRGQKPQYMEPPAPSAPSLPSVPPESEEQKEARKEFEEPRLEGKYDEEEEAPKPKTQRVRLTAENAPDYVGKKVYFKSGGAEYVATITKASRSGIMIDEGPANLKNNLTFGRAMFVDAEAPKEIRSSSSVSGMPSTPMGPVIEEKQEARGPVAEEKPEAPEPRQVEASKASSVSEAKRQERLDRLEKEILERAEASRKLKEEKDKALLEKLRAKRDLALKKKEEEKEKKKAHKEWLKEWNTSVRRYKEIRELLETEKDKATIKELKKERSLLKEYIAELEKRRPVGPEE